METNPLVRKLDGYALLSDEDKTTIRTLCAERVENYHAKRDIIRDGDCPNSVHLILEGWAARYKVLPDGSRSITAVLIPGDFCDLHITVLAKMDHGIMTLSRCKVAHLDSAKLNKLTEERTMLTKSLWWTTLVDEAVLRQWVINSRRPAIQAIAHVLCELHVRMKSVGLATGGRFDLPLTQEDLADATGMTPVHMNRTLQAMREQGLIELRRTLMFIPDVTALAKVGGFEEDYLHLRNGKTRRGERD